MENKIQQKIAEAKKMFDFEEITGNIFKHLSEQDILKKFGLLIFKEDIGKLSGFIAYPTSDLTIICINYKRSLGHQNFTLAHELGHYFLHARTNIDDSDLNLKINSEKIEKEANKFANELLYSEEKFEEDYKKYIMSLNPKKEITMELCDKINELCHLYCVSFEFILSKICNKEKINFKKASLEVKRITNGIARHYDWDFYSTYSEAEYYKRYEKPYELLKEEVIKLLHEKKISLATAESILYTNNIEFEDINDISN